MSFKDLLRHGVFSDSALRVYLIISTVIALIFVVWLMVDANAAVPNPTQTAGVTAGVVIFTTLGLLSWGAGKWMSGGGWF